jgi:hypothetical protein
VLFDLRLGRISMIGRLALSTCAALPFIALISGPASAASQTLTLDPSTAPELTYGSVNPYSNSFTTTKKNEGIGDKGMFYFTLAAGADVSIWFSGFTVSDVKNNTNPTIGGAVLSLCDVTCQLDWMGAQPTAVNIQVADYVAPGGAPPQGIEPSQQTEYFSSAGWWLPANTGGDVYELCFDGIQTKKGPNSFTGNVTIAAPEASTWAMMALGFAGLGFMGSFARKRRGADPFAA